jgi:methylmalonyl-CoA epimerase
MNAQAVRQALGGHVLGVDHMALAVRNLEASLEWYVSALGFRLCQRQDVRGEHTGMNFAAIECGAVTLVLVEGSETESQVTRFIEERGEGISHIALAVDDLDQALARIEKETGLSSLPPVEDAGIRQAFLERDVRTGVRIELIERRGGSFSERSVQEMFRVLEERDLY